MTEDEGAGSNIEIDAELIGERRHLLSLAFRMLGTIAEAEDAVQETYVRWYRMSQADRDRPCRLADARREPHLLGHARFCAGAS